MNYGRSNKFTTFEGTSKYNTIYWYLLAYLSSEFILINIAFRRHYHVYGSVQLTSTIPAFIYIERNETLHRSVQNKQSMEWSQYTRYATRPFSITELLVSLQNKNECVFIFVKIIHSTSHTSSHSFIHSNNRSFVRSLEYDSNEFYILGICSRSIHLVVVNNNLFLWTCNRVAEWFVKKF